MKNFIKRYKNAIAVTKQLKQGEWKFAESRGSIRPNGLPFALCRGDYDLWIANGSFFCDIQESKTNVETNAFGLIFRHYVWWFGVRPYIKKWREEMIPTLYQ